MNRLFPQPKPGRARRKDVPDSLVCLAVGLRWWAHRAHGIWMNPDTLLEAWTGAHEKVVERAMERALDRGLLEYGVSLRGAWLTEKGERLYCGTLDPPTRQAAH